jgi:hypothetical protein
MRAALERRGREREACEGKYYSDEKTFSSKVHKIYSKPQFFSLVLGAVDKNYSNNALKY